jgi:hypothetical protein
MIKGLQSWIRSIPHKRDQVNAIIKAWPIIKVRYRLFRQSYPIARAFVQGMDANHYPGPVRMQIAYQQTRTELIRLGMLNDDITGAVIYIALGIAYMIFQYESSSAK